MDKKGVWTGVLLFSLWIPAAHAYIDPGSGSAIMSAIIGFFVAAGIAVKSYWYKLKSFFCGKKTSCNKAECQKQD